MRIDVDAVAFVDREGEGHFGTAFFATVENDPTGRPTLLAVGVRYMAQEREITLTVPTFAFSNGSYVRLCAAAGVEP